MSETDLCRLVYTSLSNFGQGDDDAQKIVESVLESSRRRNGESNVTGALLYTEDKFAQVLEGSAKTVAETFLRIQGDPRHRMVRLHALEPIAERMFSKWSMAFVGEDGDLATRFVAIFASVPDDDGAFGSAQVADIVNRHLSHDRSSVLR